MIAAMNSPSANIANQSASESHARTLSQIQGTAAVLADRS